MATTRALSCLITFLVLTLTEGHLRHWSSDDAFLPCGEQEPTTADRNAQQKALRWERLRHPQTRQLQDDTLPVIIPVCFHVIQPWFTLNPLYNRLQLQLDALNRAFSSSSCCDTTLDWCQEGSCSIDTGIKFAMAKFSSNGTYVGYTDSVSDDGACATRQYSRNWQLIAAGSPEEWDMKSLLRKGDHTVLNIYFTASSVSGKATAGFATFPWNYEGQPMLDGVVVDPTTTVGSWLRGDFSEGDVLHHEVG